MSSLKPTLVISGICILAVNAAIGCTASSEDPFGFDDGEDSGPPAILPEGGPQDGVDSGKLEPVRDSGKDTSVPGDGGDSGKQDGDAIDGSIEGGPVEAGTDAGADAGPTGSPCTTPDQIQNQPCGYCGTQTRLCGPASSDPGAPLVWQEWGYCRNEADNGCSPGTESTESCGLCGTRARVCQNNCRWAVGACKNEPANACAPATKDYQLGLSCDEGGRERVCQSNCQYGSFGSCFIPGEPTLTLVATVGTKVSGEFNLDVTKTMGRLDGTCPTGSIASTLTAFQYVVLDNPTTSTLVVAVGTAESLLPGAEYIDTVVASYANATKPVTDADRKACVEGRNDDCTDSDPDFCDSSWAGLTGGDRVTVAPNSKVLVYVGAYYADEGGKYRLIARTDTVTP